MKISRLSIGGLLLIEPDRIRDTRGFFSETFRADWMEGEAGSVPFVQENHVFSARAGTVRGLHFQKPPRAQGKLVRVTRGAIFDVAVDIRHGSPTYGRHESVKLSAENWRQLWIPQGFLHGYCTLSEDVEVVYKVTKYYSPQDELAVRWNDPDLRIGWPLPPEALHLSERDRGAPCLRDLVGQFEFD